MSEGTVAQASDTTTSAPAPVASPPVEAPVAAPTVSDTSASSVTEPAAPAVGTASDITPPVVATPAPHVAPTADAPKPAETAPAVEPVAPEVAAEPIAPAYEFKMPEGFEAKPEVLAGYTDILSKYTVAPEGAQELLDLHATKMREYDAQKTQEQQDVWANTQKDWQAKVDKTFGKDRDQVVGDANWAINDLVKTKAERKELFEVLAYTGAGNHPAVIRAFANAAKKLRERGAPPAGISVSPKESPAERRYNKTK